MATSVGKQNAKECTVKITMNNADSGSILFGDAHDETSIDCGDFSEERLLALLADTERRIRAMWSYMANRSTVERPRFQ